MVLLALGLLLWMAAHLFGRVAPGLRAAMGRRGRAVLALIVVASVVLMVIGYRQADGAVFWGPQQHLVKLNNIMMLFATYFFAAAGMKTSLVRDLRHPMLWGVVVWAAAHLIVNGDTPSFLLFGGMAAWALVQMLVINRSASSWEKPPARPQKYEVYAVAGTFAVYIAAIGVHYLLGYSVIG